MIGSIFSVNLLRARYILALFLLIFALLAMHLQSLKAPWVDECYSYYGVWHDNFPDFYDSILTGINFSPPLYFFFNFCIQLVFPTSIDQLRLQSLVFILLGIILTFFLTRKLFGSPPAFIGTILVGSQSSLLLMQAQEARHYSMFFACGAWVLYMLSLNESASKKNLWLTFIAHFCLCQIHYLGIIFSFLSGTAYFLSSNNKIWWKRIPILMNLGWLISTASYLFYFSNQKSILNTWPKPNELSHLLATLNDSLLPLTVLIPIIIIIISQKPKRDTDTFSIEKIPHLKPIIITSVLWLTVPFIFWVLSQLTPLNLFVDRYFIPKESALIILFAYGIHLILQKLPKIKSMSVPILVTFLVSVVLILVSTKRAAFGLDKATNYHHSLIIEKPYSSSEQPIIFKDDPKYFPNAYLGKNQCLFALENDSLIEVYQKFSSKIKFLKK